MHHQPFYINNVIIYYKTLYTHITHTCIYIYDTVTVGGGGQLVNQTHTLYYTNPETAAVHRLRYYALTECSAMTFSD